MKHPRWAPRRASTGAHRTSIAGHGGAQIHVRRVQDGAILEILDGYHSARISLSVAALDDLAEQLDDASEEAFYRPQP